MGYGKDTISDVFILYRDCTLLHACMQYCSSLHLKIQTQRFLSLTDWKRNLFSGILPPLLRISSFHLSCDELVAAFYYFIYFCQIVKKVSSDISDSLKVETFFPLTLVPCILDATLVLRVRLTGTCVDGRREPAYFHLCKLWRVRQFNLWHDLACTSSTSSLDTYARWDIMLST